MDSFVLPKTPDEARIALHHGAEKGLLTPEDIEGASAIIQKTIADRTRQTARVASLPEIPLVNETEEKAEMKFYAAQYDRWKPADKIRCPWNQVRERLLANDGRYLRLATQMHQGGILFGIDDEGNPLVADGGMDPRELPHAGMNYFDTRHAVMWQENEHGVQISTGYEMFKADSDNDMSEEMKAFERSAGHKFVVSGNGKQYVSSWLDACDAPIGPGTHTKIRATNPYM